MPATESPFKARQMHGISVVVDAGGANLEFRKCIESFAFVPAQSVSTVIGGDGTPYTDITPATWTCQTKLLQDIEAAGSFVNYLLANLGKTKTVDFVPNGGAKVSGTLLLAAPQLGGDTNAWLESTITHGVIGAPQVSGTSATPTN